MVTENMSRPLKPEVSYLVAEAAHRAEVPAEEQDGGDATQGGCVVQCG